MLGKTSIWVRFFRRKIHLWIVLVIAACKIIYLRGTEQEREKARLQIALAKIDLVNFYAFINDLLW